MSDISNQLIKDSYNYVLQSDLSTGIIYRIGGGIPVNPIFLSGLTINQSFNYANGSEQPGYVLISDAFGNASWGPISGSSSGNYLSISGGTVTGPTIFTSGLTANIFSATTYLNLPNDIFVTGGTYSAGTATFTNNTGGTFNVVGFYTGATDVFVTGGTYSNGTATFTNNTGGTFNVSGFSTTSIPHITASGTDNYTSTVPNVSSYNDGDAYLVRYTIGNTTNCSLNINSLGDIPLYKNDDGPLIGGDIWDGAEMLCVYNSTSNIFQCIGTSPNSLFSYVTNADSVTLTKGMPVYAFGGTGDRMTVKRASNTGDNTSAQTVGLVFSSSIGTNQKGIIIMQGLLSGLNILPTSTYNDGDGVYLGATAGTITNLKPHAPNHLVYLGVVTTASPGSAGRMYVRIQNGYELEELHNVVATGATYGDLIVYSAVGANNLWVRTKTLTGNYTINGNLNVTGTTTTNTISATTYQNLPTDIRVTGATKSGTVATFTNNTGGTFTLTGLTDTFTTGATYSNNTFTYTNNTGGTFSVLFNTVTGLTVNGNLNVTGTTTSTTISATTYQNLPVASELNSGIITTGTQNISGIKTFSDSPILSSETSSRIAIIDASQKIKSSTVNLTTLSYLDATSSIQTQLNKSLVGANLFLYYNNF